MQAYQENISAKVNGVLTPILGVKVTVTDDSTGNPATLFSDNGITQITSDIVTDETGYFGFRAANGSYTVSFSSPQIRLASRNIDLYDPLDDAPLTQSQAAASSGASKIGIGAETVENALSALQLADYTALRAYTGPRKSVYVVAPGIAGMFIRDDSDTTSTDNGGTVVVSGNGKRWKRAYAGPVSLDWFGAKADGVTDAAPAMISAIATGTSHIVASEGQFLFLSPIIAANRGATGKPLTIEGRGAQFDNGGGTTFLMRTGTYMADFTGSQYVKLKGIHMLASGGGASTMGVIFGRTATVGFAQGNVLEDLIINLPSVPGASVLGSVGVINHGAELMQMMRCYVTADTPIVYQLAAADFNFFVLPSGNALTSSAVSMTTCTNYDCTFQARTGYAMVLSGASNILNVNCTIDLLAGNTANAAILIQSSSAAYQKSSNIKFLNGDIEHFPRLAYITQDAPGIQFDDVNVSGITGAAVLLYSGVDAKGLRLRINDANESLMTLIESTFTSTVTDADIHLKPYQTLATNGITFKGGAVGRGSQGISMFPGATATPDHIGEMVFENTSSTQMKIKVMCPDGVVRSASLTLS